MIHLLIVKVQMESGFVVYNESCGKIFKSIGKVDLSVAC